jgi:hypothetical protein
MQMMDDKAKFERAVRHLKQAWELMAGVYCPSPMAKQDFLETLEKEYGWTK